MVGFVKGKKPGFGMTCCNCMTKLDVCKPVCIGQKMKNQGLPAITY